MLCSKASPVLSQKVVDGRVIFQHRRAVLFQGNRDSRGLLISVSFAWRNYGCSLTRAERLCWGVRGRMPYRLGFLLLRSRIGRERDLSFPYGLPKGQPPR